MESAVDEVRNLDTVDDQADDHNDRVDDRDDQADDHGDRFDGHDDRVDNHDDRADDRGDRVDDNDDRSDDRTDDQPDDQADDRADDNDDLADDTEIDQFSKQETGTTDDASSKNSTHDVVTHQLKSLTKIPSSKPSSHHQDTDQNMVPSTGLNDIEVDVEGGYDLDVELALGPGGCLSASAGVGSASKDLCGGFTNLECRYPNVGCELSCGCEDGLELVSDCTMELCSANCILGCLAFSLGLALDTKAIWNQDGVEFEVLGTGIETSQGTVIRILGSGIGIIDDEKRETMEKKRKVKEARSAQKKALKEKEKIVEKATELEVSGKDNTAAEIEEESVTSP